MVNKPGGIKNGKPSPGEQMKELSGQQGKLNQRAKRLTQQMSEQMRLSAGDQDEMRRLSEDERRIREQLEQIQQDDATRIQMLRRLHDPVRGCMQVEKLARYCTT